MNRHKRRTLKDHEARRRDLENVARQVSSLIVTTEDDGVREGLINVLSTVRLAIRSLEYDITRQ